MCLELYELQDGELWPANVITLKPKDDKNQSKKTRTEFVSNNKIGHDAVEIPLFHMSTAGLTSLHTTFCVNQKSVNQFNSLSVAGVKDYIRYLYFEHRCEDGKPQTAKMCLFYHTEGGKCP